MVKMKEINIGVVLAGGRGNRYGSNVPKQYLQLANHEVINYAINALKNSNVIDVIVVACDKQYQERIRKQYDVEVSDGGDTRNITVQNTLDYINKNYTNVKKIIFVDSARPLCRGVDVVECIKALDHNDSVITGQKITDSLGSYTCRNLNREDYYLVQTPEAFRYDVINHNFDINSTCTALYQQIPEDSSLYVYFGMKNNMKITYPGDIGYIENNFADMLEK